MKQIAIVGKPFQGFTSYMKLAHPEIELIGFCDRNDNFKYPISVKKVFNLDFSSKKILEKDLTKIPTKNIIGLESQYENGILAKSWIGEILKLPAINEEAAISATDKGLMRRRFEKVNPSITPAFKIVKNLDEVKLFAKKHGFPLILKPANLAKSLLVTKSDNLNELLKNYKTSCEQIGRIYKKYGVHHRKPRLILEEYLEGRAFSVDLFVDSRNNATVLPPAFLVMAQELGINDNYNYLRVLPSEISTRDQESLKNSAIEGARALGLSNSAAHCELIMTKKGPKIIEIGARVGGYRSKMYNLSYGVNMYENIYKLAVGEPINIDYSFKAYSAVYELFPEKGGIFNTISNVDKLKKLKSFVSFKNPARVASKVGLSKDGFKFCANITLSHEDKNQFERDCKFIEKNVKVVLN